MSRVPAQAQLATRKDPGNIRISGYPSRYTIICYHQLPFTLLLDVYIMKVYTPYITVMVALLRHTLGSPPSTSDDSKMVFGFSEVGLYPIATTIVLTYTNS